MTQIAVWPDGHFESLADIPRSSTSGEADPQGMPGGQAGVDLGGQIGGVGFEVFATLGAALGRLTDEMAASRKLRGRPGIPPEAITPVYIPGTPVALSSGAGSLDVPQLYGPTLGRMWDIHSIIAANFTAGTVQVQRNAIDPAGFFSAAGELTYGKNQQVLQHGDRLTFTASGITLAAGAAALIVVVRGTCVLAPWWADYAI